MFWNCPVETVYLGRNILLTTGTSTDGDPLPPFYNNENIKTISIGNLVTTIDDCTFQKCSALTHISFGKSVVAIGKSALFGCDALESIISLNPTPPALDTNFDRSQYFNIVVYVPQKSLSAYQTADNWKDFWDIRAVETDGIESVETISENKPTVIYDLQGHKLGEPQRGINIINGKKLLVK